MFDSHIILPQCTNMYTIRLATTHYKQVKKTYNYWSHREISTS